MTELGDSVTYAFGRFLFGNIKSDLARGWNFDDRDSKAIVEPAIGQIYHVLCYRQFSLKQLSRGTSRVVLGECGPERQKALYRLSPEFEDAATFGHLFAKAMVVKERCWSIRQLTDRSSVSNSTKLLLRWSP